mmetsp:Transcript_14737/g.37067  ORF Transcript_14737/g.37067 Transcript_14737/m.37067 type:complete len:230 (-) Transcript_14737:315-1004(-)
MFWPQMTYNFSSDHHRDSGKDMGLTTVLKKEFALTTFNIQVHRKLYDQESTEVCSRPQDFIHGIETLFVPGTGTKGRRFLWKIIVDALEDNSVILGQVHNACDDSGTLVIVKAPEAHKKNKHNTKEQPRIAKELPTLDTSTTGSLTSNLSSNDDGDFEPQTVKANGHIRRRYEYLSKLVESTIRKRRKDQWKSSLREPTKHNDKMEMVFFDRIPVEESFQEVFVFEGLE